MMTDNELREACEMAGLNVSQQSGGVWVVIIEDGRSAFKLGWTIHFQSPALPAYVAELLTAKVRELGDDGRWMLAQHGCLMDTPEQRIRAAMAVLKGGGE